MQDYKTIEGEAKISVFEKKSEFIGHIKGVTSETEALEFLEKIRTENRTANHNVYAYILRDENRVRYSDDGEPTKTAGLPVLEVLQHTELTDVICVVTRYFGGTLLGTGGLVRAYTKSAQEAISSANVVTVTVCVDVKVTVDYSLHDSALKFMTDSGAKVNPCEYSDKVTLSCTMPSGTESELLQNLTELTRGGEVEISEPYHTGF